MSFAKVFYEGIVDFSYLWRSKQPSKNKLKIILFWVKINFKFLVYARLFNLKSENIFGYKVDAFDYGAIRFLFQEIFYRNEYFFNSQNKKPIILDCGANIGFATIFFKWIYPESEVYAFEPDKKTFEILKKNINQNKIRNVHLFNSAISNRKGKITFFMDSRNPGSLVMSTKKERMSQDNTEVECITLSDLIKKYKLNKIDFIKMDIEGSEKESIEDLDKNQKLRGIDKLIVEYHHKIGKQKSKLSEFLKIFEKNGFEYQIEAKNNPINSEEKFQDILLYFYKKQNG